jgi:DNA helicase-2/ATP-dependent DNA helicase PcrA
VLEALDLPAVDGTSSAPALDPRQKLAALAPFPEPAASLTPGPIEGPLVLSHSAIDAYLTCPRKYQYAQVLRVPTAPHHSLVYGSALHQVVQEFHRAEARGRILSEEEMDAALDRAWTNEGFVSRAHEQARLAAARESLHRFRAGQMAPGAVTPAWVEREFAFSLDGDRIRGRFDRVDIVPTNGAPDADAAMAMAAAGARADVLEPTLQLLGREQVTITDYKSSDVRDPAKARQRTRESLQLQIYAMAYEAMTGRLPDAVQLHFLDSGLVGRAPVEPERLAKARAKISVAAAGIRARDYTPRPEPMACSYCPFRDICPASAAR